MATDLPFDFVNYSTVEHAHTTATVMQKKAHSSDHWERIRAEEYAQRGMRAARSRDPRVMKVLEEATEVLVKVSNHQLGEYRQRSDVPYSHKVEPTEVQMWREAYRLADEGNPIENFKWIYAAATQLAYG